MKKLLLATAAIGLMAAGSTVAHAGVLTGSFTISVFQGVGNGTSTDPVEQANRANPLLLGAPVATFTYTGALDFSSPPGPNTVAGFIASGGGTTSGDPVPTTVLSTGGFADTTLLKITGVTATMLAGTIDHDDGISLYQGATTIVDASAPTVVSSTSYVLPAGAFELLYVEANGLPAELQFNASPVPEPMTFAMLGTGLLGLGLVRRRRA
jgi:hypothetical protein